MLETTLNDQKQQLELLLSLLQQEKNALEHDDMSALLSLAENKQQVLDQIAHNDQTLAKSADLQQRSTEESIQQMMLTLQQLLEKAQQQNQVNGEIIVASNQRIQQLSQVVNQLRHQNATTYDKLGQKHSSGRIGKGFKA